MKHVPALMFVFVTGPIWYYLFYRVLSALGADSLMWFLYWVYVPAGFVAAIIGAVATKDAK